MRLVIATPLYPPEIGGPATYAKILEEGLPKLGIEVVMVKFSAVRHLPHAIRQIVFCFKLFAKARRADVILSLDTVSVGWPAYVVNLVLHKKLILKIVGDHIWEQGSQRFGITDTLDSFPRFSWYWHPYLWFLRALQHAVVHGAHRIIVPSVYLRSIVQKWGIPPGNIEVIYNAVPMETSGSVPEAVASLQRPLIASAGRLVPWKHFDGVIDAVAALRAKGVLASLVIVGDGPRQAEIERYARNKLGDSYLVLGLLPHADTLAVLKSADAFTLNSSYEGLSHVLIEALALGVPIVATKVGGNGEVVTDGEDGLLVASGDTGALMQALERVLTDVSLRDSMRVHAQVSAQRFSTGAMLATTTQLLKSLC